MNIQIGKCCKGVDWTTVTDPVVDCDGRLHLRECRDASNGTARYPATTSQLRALRVWREGVKRRAGFAGLLDVVPRLDNASLTRAHVALATVESELRSAGRTEAADALSYADLIVLAARNALMSGEAPEHRRRTRKR